MLLLILISMCISPINIKNPYHGTKSQFHDVISTYIQVPCGVCHECTKNKQLEFVHMLQFYQYYMNDVIFFITLTYKDEMLPIYHFSQTVHFNDGSTLDSMPCIDYSHVQTLKMRFRNEIIKYTKLLPQWVFCAEYGTKHHRPHYHALLFCPRSWFIDHSRLDEHRISRFEYWLTQWLLTNWAKNVAPRRHSPILIQHLDPKRLRTTQGIKSTYDCHHVTQDSTDVIFYVTKYILKYDPWFQSLRLKLYYHSDVSDDDFSNWLSQCRPRVLRFHGAYEKSRSFAKDYFATCYESILRGHPLTLPNGGSISSTFFEKKILPDIAKQYGNDVLLLYNQRVIEGIYKNKDADLTPRLDVDLNPYMSDLKVVQELHKADKINAFLLQPRDLPKELL